MRVGFDDLHHYSSHVLVDGAFDPLHAGHLAYLAAARTKGPLLCAVASDDQIRAKGKIPFLPHDQRALVVEALSLVDHVYLKDRPTEDVIRQMDPAIYAKGADWRGFLPHAQRAVLADLQIPVFYTNTIHDSSTERLRRWALADADRSLDQLQDWIQGQTLTPPETFDQDYFAGDWRAGGNTYTLEKRREIEGAHPRIIADLWPGSSVLDVGCGPGFLVQLLRECGVDAGGCDPSPDAVRMANSPRVIKAFPCEMPAKIADVVICREVLEHVPVTQIARTVYDLFRMARQAVYITTRFHEGPLFGCTDDRQTDPTHISLLTQPYLRSMCVLNGGQRRREWETALDHQGKGRVLCYAVG